MKIRQFPIIATTIVLAAVVTMIALGFWQLRRLDQKDAQLAIYAAAQADSRDIAYPTDAKSVEAGLYHRSSFQCSEVILVRSVSGTSANGRSGWAHMATCKLPDGGQAVAALGWSKDPQPPEYKGGKVAGIIAPGGRIVADPPLAGLAPLAKPDPANIPNNHLAYAGQWFLFALTGLIIFFLALRSRREGHSPQG